MKVEPIPVQCWLWGNLFPGSIFLYFKAMSKLIGSIGMSLSLYPLTMHAENIYPQPLALVQHNYAEFQGMRLSSFLLTSLPAPSWSMLSTHEMHQAVSTEISQWQSHNSLFLTSGPSAPYVLSLLLTRIGKCSADWFYKSFTLHDDQKLGIHLGTFVWGEKNVSTMWTALAWATRCDVDCSRNMAQAVYRQLKGQP